MRKHNLSLRLQRLLRRLLRCGARRSRVATDATAGYGSAAATPPLLLAMAALAIVLCGVAAHAHAAQRIVSLKPNITEILFAIGVGDRVVGVSTWCDYPTRAQSLPKVADYLQPNVEKILTLHPDVVLTSTENSRRAPIDQLRRLNVRVEILTFDTVAHTIAAIESIGRIVDARPAATQLAARLRTAVAQFNAPSNRAKPSALLLVAREPMIAAGPSSFLGELLTLSGANNVITARTPAYPRLSQERVLALHPDVTIDAEPIELFRPGPRLIDGLHILHERVTRVGALPTQFPWRALGRGGPARSAGGRRSFPAFVTSRGTAWGVRQRAPAHPLKQQVHK